MQRFKITILKKISFSVLFRSFPWLGILFFSPIVASTELIFTDHPPRQGATSLMGAKSSSNFLGTSDPQRWVPVNRVPVNPSIFINQPMGKGHLWSVRVPSPLGNDQYPQYPDYPIDGPLGIVMGQKSPLFFFAIHNLNCSR